MVQVSPPDTDLIRAVIHQANQSPGTLRGFFVHQGSTRHRPIRHLERCLTGQKDAVAGVVRDSADFPNFLAERIRELSGNDLLHMQFGVGSRGAIQRGQSLRREISSEAIRAFNEDGADAIADDSFRAWRRSPIALQPVPRRSLRRHRTPRRCCSRRPWRKLRSRPRAIYLPLAPAFTPNIRYFASLKPASRPARWGPRPGEMRARERRIHWLEGSFLTASANISVNSAQGAQTNRSCYMAN
jgi:hypothetical protein